MRTEKCCRSAGSKSDASAHWSSAIRIMRTRPSGSAARLEKLRRIGQEEPARRGRPGEVEADAQPTCQPVEIFGRHSARVEQLLHLLNASFEHGEEALGIGEIAIEKTRGCGVVLIDGGQIVREIREARIIRAQGLKPRRAVAVSDQRELYLQIAPDRCLEKQLPGAGLARSSNQARAVVGQFSAGEAQVEMRLWCSKPLSSTDFRIGCPGLHENLRA